MLNRFTLEEIIEFECPTAIVQLGFVHDHLLISGQDRSIHVVSLKTGTEIKRMALDALGLKIFNNSILLVNGQSQNIIQLSEDFEFSRKTTIQG